MSKLEDVFGEVTSLAAADVPPPAAQLQEATDAALRISLMMATAILYDSGKVIKLRHEPLLKRC